VPRVLFSLIQFSVVCYTWSIFPKNDVWRPHSSYLLNLLVLLLAYFNVSFHLSPCVFLALFHASWLQTTSPNGCVTKPIMFMFLIEIMITFPPFASLCYHIDGLLHRLFIFLTNFVQLISRYDILFLTSLCLPYIVQISNFGLCISILWSTREHVSRCRHSDTRLEGNTSTPARKTLPALLHISISRYI
jgi:hypothetical protein